MKKSILTQIILFIILTHALNATTWKVGPGQTYVKPSQVSALVADGDTVNIEAGVYELDVCAWTKNNLLLRGVNGMAHLKANGTVYGGKAIWVIQGNNTRIDHIEFSLAASTDGNAAGIRQEGHNLQVKNCFFHDNQTGILAGPISPCSIVIEYSEFSLNGTDDGVSHNLYIGNVDSLIFRYNYSHLCKGGSLLKSRSNVNYILYNRFSDEVTGTGSYQIDLSNGGMAIIIGNIVQKGSNSINSNAIAYGIEGFSNTPPHNLYLVNNTVVNNRVSGTFVKLGSGAGIYKSYNNIFAGNGALISGMATTLDTLQNKNYPLPAPVFINSVTYDYRLMASSSAINTATNAGNASNGFSLTPAFEYVHPANRAPRTASGQMDAGAYEYSTATSILSHSTKNNLSVFISDEYLFIRSTEEISSVKIISVDGKTVYQAENSGTNAVPLNQFAPGIYIINTRTSSGAVLNKKVIIQ